MLLLLPSLALLILLYIFLRQTIHLSYSYWPIKILLMSLDHFNFFVFFLYVFRHQHGQSNRSLDSVANLSNLGIKIGFHALPSRWVTAKDCKLGRSLIPALSFLYFDSLIDKACISLARAADTKATRNTIFYVKKFQI